MKPNFHRFVKPLVVATTLIVAPALVFAQQIVGFEAALSGGTYQVGTDSVNGVVDITVSASDITVTLDPGQFVRLTTTDRKEVTLSSSAGLTVSTDCTATEYIARFDVPSNGSQRNFIITPSSTTCTTGGGGGGTSTGGGGGGGGISLPAAPAPAPAPAPVPAPAPAPVTAPAVSAILGSDLQLGTKNDDVRRLQELLASDPSVYPEGLVTGYFGQLTVKAVRAFQAKYGLSQVGRVGPQTRAKLAEIFAGGQPPAAVPTPAAPVAAGFTRELGRGSKGDDVKVLQEFLAKDSSIYPERLATGFYGPATERAVRRFQATHGISQVGRVGPQTLAKLQELIGAPAPAPAPAPVPIPAPTPAPTPSGLMPDPETSKPFVPRTYGR